MRHLMFLLLCVFFSQTNVFAKTVKIGAIIDKTGPTRVISLSYASGINDYIQHINSKGGISGNKIEFETKDYEYSIPKALAIFQKFYQDPDIAAVLGWEQRESMKIASMADKQKILFVSGFVSDFLASSWYNTIEVVNEIEDYLKVDSNEEALTYIQGWNTGKFLIEEMMRMQDNRINRSI